MESECEDGMGRGRRGVNALNDLFSSVHSEQYLPHKGQESHKLFCLVKVNRRKKIRFGGPNTSCFHVPLRAKQFFFYKERSLHDSQLQAEFKSTYPGDIERAGPVKLLSRPGGLGVMARQMRLGVHVPGWGC